MHTCWTDAKYLTNALYGYNAFFWVNAVFMVHPEPLTPNNQASALNSKHGAPRPAP